MRLWVLMVTAAIASVFVLWVCTTMDATIPAEELAAEVRYEDYAS